MPTISIDFETRSAIDLTKCGVYTYAAHPTTDLWCMAWAVDDGPVNLWTPGAASMPLWPEDPIVFRAWNAQFERVIWNRILVPRYGFPELTRERWYCTQAEAMAMQLPRALGKAAKVLKLDEQKDDTGRALMLRMSRPRKPRKSEKGEPDEHGLYWWDDAERRQQLYEYCKQDVETERAMAAVIRRLSPEERTIYLHDQEINDRGVRLDVPLIVAMNGLADKGADLANAELYDLTDGAVSSVTKHADLTKWLNEQGVETDSVRKAAVRDLLERDDVEGAAREVLQLRSDFGRTSLAKLTAMTRYNDEGFARGLLLYHGAGTGRWSGMGIQPQNFPRGEIKKPERFLSRVLAEDYDGIEAEAPVPVVLLSLLRACFRAREGHSLMGADFAQIEARVLAWLACQDDLVKVFAEGGKVYEDMAAAIYRVPVESIANPSEERNRGKDTVLGCGFQMAGKTFARQLKEKDGVVVTEEFANLAVETYRAKNTKIVDLWYDIERTVFEAVRRPGSVQSVGRNGCVKYVVSGAYLYCQLPSGRLLAYHNPRVRDVEKPWGAVQPAVVVDGFNSKTQIKKWGPYALYGGLLVENVVQAIARDLMAASMLRVESNGYPVVLTVHDEILADVPDEHGSLQEYCNLMAQTPRWGAGIPVKVEGWRGERYRK